MKELTTKFTKALAISLLLSVMFGCATTLQDIQKWESQKDTGVPKLIVALENEKNPTEVRVAAAEALGRIGGSRVVEVLSAVLKDEDSDVSKAASKALVKIGDPKAVEVLAAALKDRDSDVHKAVFEALVAALKDGTSDARKAASEALVAALKDKNSDNAIRDKEVDDEKSNN